jgi:hypothetical protein
MRFVAATVAATAYLHMNNSSNHCNELQRCKVSQQERDSSQQMAQQSTVMSRSYKSNVVTVRADSEAKTEG